jgi:hypothetical protein
MYDESQRQAIEELVAHEQKLLAYRDSEFGAFPVIEWARWSGSFFLRWYIAMPVVGSGFRRDYLQEGTRIVVFHDELAAKAYAGALNLALAARSDYENLEKPLAQRLREVAEYVARPAEEPK